MLKRKYKESQLSVMGFGAGNIGSPDLPESKVEEILNFLLDNGVNFIDTARGYGLSEERIGKLISKRRSEFILSTKVGYDIRGHENWTYDCVVSGVDHALKLLNTDYIDIVHLHSCSRYLLEQGDVVDALEKTVQAGKVKYIAYSGENDALEFAISCGRFDGIQCSVNICDQRVISQNLKNAAEKGMGIIAKRPVANSPWRFDTQPVGDYSEDYWLRLQKMNLPDFGLERNELAIRFLLSIDAVSSFIIGTTNLKHIQENIKIVEKGPLPDDIFQYVRETFLANDNNWIGLI